MTSLAPRVWRRRPRIPNDPRRLKAGFTVVEALVAFSTLVLVVIVVFRAMSNSALSGARVGTLREALHLAQVKLDGIGVIEPIPDGEIQGHFENGFSWRLLVRTARTSLTTNPPLFGAWVEITVQAAATGGLGGAPSVTLATFKLAPAKAGSSR